VSLGNLGPPRVEYVSSWRGRAGRVAPGGAEREREREARERGKGPRKGKRASFYSWA